VDAFQPPFRRDAGLRPWSHPRAERVTKESNYSTAYVAGGPIGYTWQDVGVWEGRWSALDLYLTAHVDAFDASYQYEIGILTVGSRVPIWSGDLAHVAAYEDDGTIGRALVTQLRGHASDGWYVRRNSTGIVFSAAAQTIPQLWTAELWGCDDQAVRVADTVQTLPALTITAAAQPLWNVASYYGAARELLIRAPSTNAATVYLGDSGVTTATGYPLDPGDSLAVALRTPTDLYAIAAAAVGDKLRFMVLR
jgi:hypothetical protein